MPAHTFDTHVAWTSATPASRAVLHFAPQQQADRTLDVGTDDDAGTPSPHDLLDAALASCTALTLSLYAARRGIALRGAHVHVTHEAVDGIYRVTRVLDIDADHSGQQDAARAVTVGSRQGRALRHADGAARRSNPAELGRQSPAFSDAVTHASHRSRIHPQPGRTAV